MTYDDIARIALALPETEESMAYGAPCIKRAGRFMFAPKKDGESMAVKLDWDTHDRLLKESPEIYFKTPHYEGWPGFLVRFELLSAKAAKNLVEASWRDAPHPSKRRKN